MDNCGSCLLGGDMANQEAASTTWHCTLKLGTDYLGLTVGGQTTGTQTFTATIHGEVAAVPEGEQGVNHDVAWYGLQLENKYRAKWSYLYDTDTGDVWDIAKLDDARREDYAIQPFQTYKSSQEGYGANNYPRPNPYVRLYHVKYYTPDDTQTIALWGTVSITLADVPRDWS